MIHIIKYSTFNTSLFCTADRMYGTIILQNSRLIYACFPIKIDEVWIDRFCVRYDWWRRLQRTSAVSPVWGEVVSHCKDHTFDWIRMTLTCACAGVVVLWYVYKSGKPLLWYHYVSIHNFNYISGNALVHNTTKPTNTWLIWFEMTDAGQVFSVILNQSSNFKKCLG